ncbi:MAG TPA: GNAT family N-acetyltransferase [Gaiellaceae bacterium]|nr:GNAT family N-acetyltransferase [Gaiellaceae bacterium]
MPDTSSFLHGARHRVRSATPADAEAIAALKVHAWRAAYAGLLPETELAALDAADEAAAWREYLEAMPADERLWVAVSGGRVVGYARTDPGELHGLYVDPELIGAGVGRALFEHAVDDLRARGARSVAVWHFAGNERAARFYERAGMRFVGDRRPSEHGADEERWQLDL